MPGTEDTISRGEAQRKALALEKARGEEVARIDAKFKEHGQEIAMLKKEHERFQRELETVANQMGVIATAFGEHIAVGNALTKQVKEASANQVTTKTFILGLIGTIIALGILLVAGIALIHGQQPS